MLVAADLLILPGLLAGVVVVALVLTGPARALVAITLVIAADAMCNRRVRR